MRQKKLIEKSRECHNHKPLLNHEKMCIKSEVDEILFKLATNDHSD